MIKFSKATLTYTINDKKETKKGWLAEEDIKLFSAYDWEKFGFKHLNAGSEFIYSLKDQKVESITATVPEPEIAPFIKTVWDIIDTDGDKKLSNLEMKLAYDEPEKVEILSKLVCTHKNEWSYDIEKIKSEVQEIHNTSMGDNPSDELIKQVKSRILALETKMKELMFWKETKDLAYTGEVDDKLPPRMFPEKDNVHYFHPLSWVRQMKLILGSGVPPWMEVALGEAIKYKGIKEGVEPFASTIQDKYHTYTGHSNATGGTSWCASFASWCLHQAEFDNPKSWSSQSFLNHSSLKSTEIQYGAIVVFTDCYKNGDIIYDDNDNSFGHVTFAVGQLENDKYACLGGNQGDMIKVSDYDCSGDVFAKNSAKTKWRKMTGIYTPKSYSKNFDHEFTSKDVYKTISEANKKIIKLKVKTKKYENT